MGLTFSEYVNESKRITGKLLLANKSGTAHSGMQQFSNIDGVAKSWNYVYIRNNKYEVTPDKEEATHIAYKMASGKTKVEEI